MQRKYKTEAEHLAYEQGKQDTLVQKIAEELAEHQEKCDERQGRIWDTLQKHGRYIWIGFGIVITVEVILLAGAASGWW